MSNQAYNEIYGARADAAAMGSSEPSQAAMLDQMRDRLASLSDEARSIRSQVPHEFEPDVERIQQQMQRLGERLSDLGRGALVPYNSAMRATETRTKAVRFVTEEDMRVGRVQPDEIIVLGAPGAAKRTEDTWARGTRPPPAPSSSSMNPVRRMLRTVARPVRAQATRGGTQAVSGQASQQALCVGAAAGTMRVRRKPAARLRDGHQLPRPALCRDRHPHRAVARPDAPRERSAVAGQPLRRARDAAQLGARPRRDARRSRRAARRRGARSRRSATSSVSSAASSRGST